MKTGSDFCECCQSFVRAFSLSECDGSVAHATRSAKGSQSCREDADDDLNDGLPSFLLHSAFF